MTNQVTDLRRRLSSIAPYPLGCEGFEPRQLMNGTAFFPGGDGVWKSKGSEDVAFPVGGVLVLGSDFGDVVSYDAQFKIDRGCRHEVDGKTWGGLLKLVERASIPYDELFCTNAWPCLRSGSRRVKGGIPGQKDWCFTERCIQFFLQTVYLMQPRLIVPLGKGPTRFVGRSVRNAWASASRWKDIDRMPVATGLGSRIVPVIHPSMPNRKHREITFEQEAEFLRGAI
jgi:hypothetical protein